MLSRCWPAFVGLVLLLSFPASASQYKYIWAKIGYARVLVAKNEAPVAVADAFTVTEDIPQLLDVLANDSDEVMATLSVAIGQTASHGTLTETTTGVFNYHPADNFHGTDSFTYTLTDEKGKVSVPATVTLTVSPVNDAPVAADDTSLTLNEDTTEMVVLSGTDVEGDSLTFRIMTPPQHGTASLNGSQVTYQPDDNFFGSDAFSYVASDGTADSDVATVPIQVNAVNDAPEAAPGALSVDEDASDTVMLSGTDIDGDTLTFRLITAPQHGSASLSGAQVTLYPAR